jgi:hypothetical protein
MLRWIAIGTATLIAFFVWSIVISHYAGMGWDLVRPIWKTRRGVRKLLCRNFPDAKVSSMGMSSIDPRYFCILIDVKTDSEKRELLEDTDLRKSIRQAALDAGYPAESVPLIEVSIESQQTVDRDWGGNWYHARK